MSVDRIVIIGSGQAGFEAAVSLRSHGFAGSITLVGDEPGVPYQRPPLSKAYLHCDPDRDSLALRPAQYFEDHRITLACGKPVVRVDRDAQLVELIDATVIEYDHLILATGARNRLLPVPGADLPGVHYLRTAGEAESLTSSMASCSSLVVIGAGFIGLEVAAAARKKGLDVTVVEAMDRPMARALSPVMSDYFSAAHTEHGVHMRLSTGAKTVFEADGRAAGVTTTPGDVIPADAVVVGIGVVPNIELAVLAGLPVNNGIVVDEYLRTPDENISAIGDCAAYPIPGTARLVRLESVQNAVDQARCLAAQLTGTSINYRSVPWFWSEQYESKLQMAGLTAGADTHVVRGSVDSGAFSIFCFLGTRLLGVESVNKPRDHMTARKILSSGMPLTLEQAADTDFDLKLAIARHQDTHKDEVASAEVGERQVVAS